MAVSLPTKWLPPTKLPFKGIKISVCSKIAGKIRSNKLGHPLIPLFIHYLWGIFLPSLFRMNEILTQLKWMARE